MSAPRDRRGFLRGLVSLPLIGGGVTLIGKPTAAAVPTSPGMMATYLAWLHYEARILHAGLGTHGMVPHINPGAYFHDFGNVGVSAAQAMARAPVVLATAGCPLTSPEADETWASALPQVFVAEATRGASRYSLLSEYETWLGIEQRRVAIELRPGTDYKHIALHGPAFDWHKRRPESAELPRRAAMLLGTVGVDWRRAEA